MSNSHRNIRQKWRGCSDSEKKIQKGGVKIYSSKNKDINKEKDCIFIQLGEKHLVGSSTDQESFDYIQNIANRTPWVRIYTEIEK